MLDIKILRTEPDKIRQALKNRCNDLDITPAIELDVKRRELLADVEQKKAKQNEITKKIPAMKKAGENTDAIFAEMRELSDEIKLNAAVIIFEIINEDQNENKFVHRNEVIKFFEYAYSNIKNMP